MSSESILPHRGKGASRFALAAIIGSWLALQGLLPSVAFAFPHGHYAASSDVDINGLVRDRAGVSVVRLLATYGNVANTKNLVHCTSLGILVASKSVGTGYQNWVLTDGGLINTTMIPNCSAPGGNADLNELQIWPSTEYNGANIPTASQKLGDLTHCQQNDGSVTCNDDLFSTVSETVNVLSENSVPYTVFSFQNQFEQPYLTLLGSTSIPEAPLFTIELTSSTGKTDTPAVTDLGTLQNFLQPAILPSESTSGIVPASPIPSGTPASQNAPEGGTPVVDANGQLVRMLLSGGTQLESAKLQTGLQNAKVPLADNPTSFASLWNSGIADFYAGNAPEYHLADALFKQLSTLNPNFLAAKTFDMMALAKLAPPSPSSTKPSAPTPSGNILSHLFSPGPILDVVVGIVILLLIIILVLILRARRKRRELSLFEEERFQSRSQAEVEIQNMRSQRPNAELLSPPTLSERASTQLSPNFAPKPQPLRPDLPPPDALAKPPPNNVSHADPALVANIYCPHCGQEVRADTIDCPVCHYHLANMFQARVVSLLETENKVVSQNIPPDSVQSGAMGDEAGGVAIEVKLRNLWNRVGQ